MNELYMWHCLDHLTFTLIRRCKAPVVYICSRETLTSEKRFSAYHVQRGRLMLGCRIVGSVTNDLLTTVANSEKSHKPHLSQMVLYQSKEDVEVVK